MKNIRQYSFKSAPLQQRGLTLVEILVALVISLFLVAGVIQLFIGSKQTYRGYDALSRIQENGRFVLEAMARDIRMSGYYPRVTARTIVGSTITATTTTPAPAWPSQPPTNQPMAVSGYHNSNTDNGVITQWLGDDGVTFFSRLYSINLRPVASGAVKCPGAANSLFINRFDGAGDQELIEGVQRMQILYGVDTAPSGIPPRPSVARQYVPVGGVVNWNNVVSVQIYLLIVGLENNLVTTQQTVIFPDNNGNLVTVPVSGRCLGQVFSTTIALRNL